ncbi:hypothetical protein [Shewanella indica]
MTSFNKDNKDHLNGEFGFSFLGAGMNFKVEADGESAIEASRDIADIAAGSAIASVVVALCVFAYQYYTTSRSDD